MNYTTAKTNTSIIYKFDTKLNVHALPTIPSISMGEGECNKLRSLVHARKGMFYLTTHSKHFIYDYMTSDIC